MVPSSRSIIHLDLDAFFASVEILDRPSLKGLAVIVGGLGQRGVVSTCSYQARFKGVRSAMPMARARAICPEAVFLPPRMERYQELSGKVMEIFSRFTPLVEPLSLDEAFLDVSASLKLFGTAAEIAKKIKASVFEETGLTVSAGVSAIKHIAKIASSMNKPDGLTVIEEGQEKEFLWPLKISYLWGVGPSSEKILKS
ncbi:MAG: DNA polymerase IV, partial [Deltaproteobacteria bacterium]|nr:DNA polymerase IV [Deltaproteobacteria bacterium]